MIEDIPKGWHGVPPATQWKCPECNNWSNVADWAECEPYCEDCGSHDGRRCPICGTEYDHVWDSEKLAEAQK